VARDGLAVRMARSLDRPLRYFLAKRSDGPMLVVADRIDAICACLRSNGLEEQFQPSYTRMVPAHHIVEIRLVGCPDPEPTYARFFTPSRNVLPADLDEIGRRYVGALAEEVAKWLRTVPPAEPIGACFSGGVDSGAVFLVTQHVLRSLGMSPSRLKAFTLSIGDGEDLAQARFFLERLGLGLFLEPIEADPKELDPLETVRVVEDYKTLDIESATIALALCRGIRKRYPGWRYLLDGDGGDENLKDYPIEENSELTIRSVLTNPLLYQEGWGVWTVKHSLTYSGGQSRSYTRTYAPLARYAFEGFSPFTRPSVVEVAEGIRGPRLCIRTSAESAG
jgi:asparagine synthase (glutamine-hydrolysing)